MKPSGQPSLLKFCLLMLMLVSYTDAFVIGAPKGGHVVSGTASFAQDGNLTVITAGNRSVINYTGFDIGKGETVQFVQPSAHSTVLNRVTTSDPTSIFGTLQSNGIVIIANPYGVFFRNGSVVNVGGLIAGAGKISDTDFTAGKIHFTDLTGDVRNDGVIAADNRIALMGANVVNAGSLNAAHGMAMLVSGQDVYVGDKNGNIFVQANGKALRAASATGTTAASAGSVTNSGTVAAPRVVLGAGDMYSTAIVNSGLLQGRSIAVNAGKNGSATIGGTLDASSAHNLTATGQGGNIDVLGGTVALQGATLDASGDTGGGNVRVGGDFHGAGTLAHATNTTVDAASTIKADATGAAGDGGTVVLWSDAATVFTGKISAQAGATGGAGGAVEVSSHGGLGYDGYVNADSPAGKAGSLLLDPANITISSTSGNTTYTGTENVTTPGDLVISAHALEIVSGGTPVTLQASQDFKINPLTGVYNVTVLPTDPNFNPFGVTTANKLTFTTPTTLGIGSAITFTAGINTTTQAFGTKGSFVMSSADTIVTGGRTLTINAAGPSAGGTGVNAGNANAIEVGGIDSHSTTAAGAAVTLTVASSAATSAANPAPVAIDGNIDTHSSAGAGGAILIGGSAANNLPTSITVGAAGMTTKGLLTSTGTGTTAGNTGAGGAITLNSSGAVTLFNAVDASSAGAAGGAISLTGGAGGVAVSTVADTSGVSTTANVGSVAFNTSGAVLATSINTSSVSGPGGAITIAGNGGILPTSILAGAATNVATDSLLNSTATGTGAAAGAGGAISLSSSGPITLRGLTDSHSAGAAGGAISLTGGSTVVNTVSGVTTGNLTAASAVSTTGAVGSVTVNTTATAVSVAAVDTSSGSGPGGAIVLGQGAALPSGVTALGALKSSGTTSGGNINISTTGNIDTTAGDVTASGSAGPGGVVDFLAQGSVKTANITADSVGATPGEIIIGDAASAMVNFTPSSITVNGALDASNTGSGNGGEISLLTNGTISLKSATTTSSSATGGLVKIGGAAGGLTFTPSGVTISGSGAVPNIAVKATGVSGGAVNILTGGTVGVAGSGSVNVTGLINTAATTGTGGTVTVSNSTGGTTATDSFGDITTTSNSGNAGGVAIGVGTGLAPATLTLGGAITASSTSGAGGNVVLVSNGGLTSGSAAALAAISTAGGTNGGTVGLTAGTGALNLTSVTTTGGSGTGGNITLTSAGLTSGALTASGATGGGTVILTSSGGITVSGAINTSTPGAGNGGPVSLLSNATSATTTNAFTTAGINTSSGTGTGGTITVGNTGAGAVSPTSVTFNGALNTAGGTAGPINVDSSTGAGAGSGTITFVQTTGAPTRYTLTGDTSLSGSTLVLSNGATAQPLSFDLTNHNLTLNLSGGVTVDGTYNGTSGKFDRVNNFSVVGTTEVTTIDGNFSTEGNQTYGGASETITANVLLQAGATVAGGSLFINAPLYDSAAGTHTLTLQSGTTGGATINANIGGNNGTTNLPLLALIASSEPTVTIDAKTVTTTGSQNYGPLALGGTGTTTLTSTATTGTTTITAGAVTGNSQPLTVNEGSAAGTASFGTITGAGALNFTVAGTGTFGTINDTTPVTFTGGTANFGAVTAGDVTATGSGTVTFGGTLTAGNVVVNGTGASVFSAPVTATSVSVSKGSGITLKGGTVTTTGAQTYSEPATLGVAATTLKSTSGGAITLGAVAPSATGETLTINTAGTTSLTGAVGNAGNSLGSLSVTGTGDVDFAGGSVTTSAGQAYTGKVVLAAGTIGSTIPVTTTLTDTGNAGIDFNDTVNGNPAVGAPPQALSLTTATTGAVTFGGAVGNTTPLASLTEAGGPVDVNGGGVTTVATAGGTQTYGGQVVLGANATFTGYSAAFNGGITSGTAAGTPFNLTLNFTQQVSLPGLSLTNIRDFTSEGAGGVQINGNFSTQGSQTFLNGPVTIAANVMLEAGTVFPTGSITLGSAVDDTSNGAHTLTLVTGTSGVPATSGGVTISAPVGSSHPLLSLTATNRTTTPSGGPTTSDTTEPVTISATSVKTTGAQSYGTLTLGGTGTTTLTAGTATGALAVSSGAVTGGGNPLTVVVNGAGGNTTFGTITGAGALNFTVPGTATFGTINDPAGSVTFSGGSVGFAGLGATDVLVTQSGTATFGGIGAGNVTVNGTGSTSFNGAVNATSVTVSNGSGVGLNGGAVTTTGAQSYNEVASLGAAATTLKSTGGGAIGFVGAINPSAAGESLTINTSGATTLGGAVGNTTTPLGSLAVTGSGAVDFTGGSVRTSAGQSYTGPVVLAAGTIGSTTPVTTTLIDSGAATGIAFTSSINGNPAAGAPPQALSLTTATTGAVTLGGLVGNTTPLASFTEAGGKVNVSGGGVTTVTTPGGTQTYGGQVVLVADAVFTGYSLTLASTGLLGQAHDLTLDFTTQVTLPSAITGVNNFLTDGAGGALLNGAFMTTGNQTYSVGPVTASGAPSLTSTAGVISFNVPVDGNAPLTPLTLTATGPNGQVVFNAGLLASNNALVGNATPLGALTISTTKGTLFDMTASSAAANKGGVNAASVAITGPVTFGETGSTLANNTHPSVLTTGTQTYSGAATLAQDTSLFSSGGGNIAFNTAAATVDSAVGTEFALNVNTAGVQTFTGLIGAANMLDSLTTGSGETDFSMSLLGAAASVQAGVRVDGPVTTTGVANFNVAGSTAALPSVLTLSNGNQTYGTLPNPLTNPLPTAVILTGASTALNSASTDSPNGTFHGGGTITFNGNIVSPSGTSALDVRAGVGTLVIGGPINTSGGFAPGGASVVFKGSVGPLGNLVVLPNDLGTGGGGVDLNGASVTSGLGQSYASSTVLSANTTLTVTGAGSGITFGGTLQGSDLLTNNPYSLTINTNGGTVAFNGIVGGTVPLLSLAIGNTGATVGTTLFNMTLPLASTGLGGVNVLNTVQINTNADFEAIRTVGSATTPTILSGVTYNNVVGTGAQTYGAAVTLGQDTVLTNKAATNGDITFASTVDSKSALSNSLTVNAVGDETFNGRVGGTYELTSLTTDDLAANVTGGHVIFNVAGTAAAPSVTTSSGQTYNDAATLKASTVLADQFFAVTFHSTVDSDSLLTPRPLTINVAGGDVVFQGLIGASAPLASLNATAFDETQFLMTLPLTGLAAGVGGINTTGNVTINDRTTLFQIGNTVASHPSVVSGGTQTYNSSIEASLGANTILTSTGGSIVFNAPVDGNSATDLRDLTTNTPTVGSVVTFAQPVGGGQPLASLTTNGAGTTQINGGAITTVGNQEYFQAATMGQNTQLLASGTGARIDFTRSLDGTFNLATTSAIASFRAVGNTAPLANFTVNAPASILFTYDPTLVTPGHAGVNLAGALTLNGPVLFDASNAGNVVFVHTGETVPGTTLPSSQDYFGAFTLTGSATFTDTQSGAITFHHSVDGTSVANLSDLTASTGGTISFLNPVGAMVPLTSLTTSNLGLATGLTVLDGGTVTTINRGSLGGTGAQTYNDAVILDATTTLTSLAGSTVASGGDATLGGPIVFASTVDSNADATPQVLMVNTSALTVFGGPVGATHALASVTTDGEGAQDLGTSINGGSVRTTGAQTYNDIVTLGLGTTLTSTAGGDIDFVQTLDSHSAATPQTLTVNTSGRTIFGGKVGSINALASLRTTSSGAEDLGTFINGGRVRTVGTQTYDDGVALGADTTLVSTANGALTFNGTVNGLFALTLNTGGLTVFNNLVGNSAQLTSLTTDNAGVGGEATQFNMTVGGASAGVVVNGPVTINDAVLFNIKGASLGQPGVLTVGNANQTYNGPVLLDTSTYLVSALAIPAAGAAFTGGGSVAFNSTQGIASAGGSDLFVRAGVGADTFASPINASVVNLGGAAATFGGPVNLTGTLSVAPNDTTPGVGSIVFNGGNITTVTTQNYNAPVFIGNNSVLTSTGGGDIAFGFSVDGAHSLTLNSTGNESFGGQVGGTDPLLSLITDDPASGLLGGHVIFGFAGTTASPSIKTTGAQTYNDAATVGAATVLASTGGTVAFGQTVDSSNAQPYALTVNAAGNELFAGRVGGLHPLLSLTTDDPAGSIAGGQVIFGFAGTTAAPSVKTTQTQTYNDAAVLFANTVLASTGGGTLTFAKTIDSDAQTTPRSLILNTSGDEDIDGQVGGNLPLLSLTTDDPAANTTGGHTVFMVPGGNRSVITTTFQTYNDAVTLAAATNLTSTGNGALTFASTINGTFALTLNTGGTTTFNGAVGNGPALASLTTRTGLVVFNGSTVTTTGLQSYGGPASLGLDTILTSTAAGGGITFATTVDGNHALTLNAVGDETFNGRVGSAVPLVSLTTDDPTAGAASGRVIFNVAGTTAAPSVTTTTFQTYNDDAVLQTNTALVSSGGGTLTFNGKVDSGTAGATTLVVNSSGDEVFGGAVGSGVPLNTLVTDENTVGQGRVFFGLANAASPLTITTVNTQTYNDLVFLRADTTLASRGPVTATNTGNIIFNSTVNNDPLATTPNALTINTAGDEIFAAAVGDTNPLRSLVTDDPGSNLKGGTVFFGLTGANPALSVTTTGLQTYNDPAVLRVSMTLTSNSGGALTFNSKLDSSGNGKNSRALTLNTSGNEVFNGLIGSTAPLGNLVIDADGPVGGQTRFNMTVPAGGIGARINGKVTINDAVLFNAPGSNGGVTLQSTGAQTYNGLATLGADAVLTSPNAAVTFAKKIDSDNTTPHALTINTGGTTTLNGAIGSGNALSSLSTLGGVVALNGGSVNTTVSQDYVGVATLGQSTGLTSGPGGIEFHNTVDATADNASSLTLTTSNNGATTFDQPVGAQHALTNLTANDGSDVVIKGGSVTTLGLQTYGGVVTVNQDGGSNATLLALNGENDQNAALHGNFVFKQNVNVVGGGGLLVKGHRILAEANSDFTVQGSGDLDLEASNVLILQGDSYESDSGRVTLNDPHTPMAVTLGGRATILLTNTRTTFRGSSFDMGYLQNLYSLGSVVITVPGGTATLSDISANNSLTVTAGSIFIQARNGDGSRTGGTDDGVNFVAKTAINFGNAPIRYLNGNSMNDVANFVTSSGNVTVNRDQSKGISIFQDETLSNEFQKSNADLNLNTLDADFASVSLPLQLISGGTQTIDTAAALSGALPDQKPIDVAVDITVTAGQLEELKKLGIHPRRAARTERLSLSSKRALFAQLVDGLDKDNYGMLQPIKNGISTLVPSDYVVVVDRMSEREVQAILTAFEDLYGKNKEKAPPIGEAFNTAFNDYATEKQTADPAGFAPYILSKPGKYPEVDKAVRGFDNLFGYIESLGLTNKEQAKSKEHIASDLQVAGVSPEDMVKVIDTLRSKIPKAQKAPSTQLPPAAPASNPAPGATNPPTPASPPASEKKAAQPKTAGRSQHKDSNGKTVRLAKPVKPDLVHEVAGL